MKNTVSALLFSSLVLLAWSSAASADRVYHNPRIAGFKLDWCLTWGRNCGRPAADAYCRRRGHPFSTGFAKRNNVPPTRIITTGQICNGGFCDSFRYIRCKSGSRPATRVFVKPRWQGAVLDWCLTWGRNCGRPVADRYCRIRGFTRSAGYGQWTNIGHIHPTRIITTGQICNQRFCDGFSFIRCVR